MLAQARLRRYRLNENGERFVLATSAQPCCQCYGATIWPASTNCSAARAEDVEELTEFDEGPCRRIGLGELERRGICVRRDILREAHEGYSCVIVNWAAVCTDFFPLDTRAVVPPRSLAITMLRLKTIVAQIKRGACAPLEVLNRKLHAQVCVFSTYCAA